MEKSENLRVFSGAFRLNQKMEPITLSEFRKKRIKNYAKADSETVVAHYIWCPVCHEMDIVYNFITKKNGKHFYKNKKWSFEDLKKLREEDSRSFFPIPKKVEKEYPKIGVWSSENDLMPVTRAYSFRTRKNNPIHLTCPSCGYKFKYFEASSTYSFLANSPSILQYRFFDDCEDKLVLSITAQHYLPSLKAKKVLVQPFRYRIVFNTKTGNTYFMYPVDLNNKHPKGDNCLKIFNATHHDAENSEGWYSYLVNHPDIVRETAERLLKIHGGSDKQLTLNGIFTDTSFNMVLAYNKNPYFCYDFYRDSQDHLFKRSGQLLSYEGSYRKSAKVNRFLYTINKKYHDGEDALTKYVSRGKVKPKKKLKKMFFENPIYLLYFRMLVALGFSNIDVITNILINATDICCCCFNCLFDCNSVKSSSIKKFFDEVIRKKGEGIAAKVLFLNCSDFSLVRDAANMLVSINSKKYETKDCFKGTAKEIHDRITHVYNKIKQENLPISYEPKEENLEQNIGEYFFKLARDTYELHDIGAEMHICVGSYGARAVQKKCIIVSMLRNKKHVGCIEIVGTRKVIQAKAKRNAPLQGEDLSAFNTWVTNLGLTTKNCSDIANIPFNGDELPFYDDLEFVEFDEQQPMPNDDEWLPF